MQSAGTDSEPAVLPEQPRRHAHAHAGKHACAHLCPRAPVHASHAHAHTHKHSYTRTKSTHTCTHMSSLIHRTRAHTHLHAVPFSLSLPLPFPATCIIQFQREAQAPTEVEKWLQNCLCAMPPRDILASRLNFLDACIRLVHASQHMYCSALAHTLPAQTQSVLVYASCCAR